MMYGALGRTAHLPFKRCCSLTKRGAFPPELDTVPGRGDFINKGVAVPKEFISKRGMLAERLISEGGSIADRLTIVEGGAPVHILAPLA